MVVCGRFQKFGASIVRWRRCPGVVKKQQRREKKCLLVTHVTKFHLAWTETIEEISQSGQSKNSTQNQTIF